MKGTEAKARVVIESITPQIDGGQYAIKRVPGETITVRAAVFADGHDVVAARLLHRKSGEKKWKENPLVLIDNDEWEGSFMVSTTGYHEYAIAGWIDHSMYWYEGFQKKAAAGEKMETELAIGALIVEKMEKLAKGDDHTLIQHALTVFNDPEQNSEALEIASSEKLKALIEEYPIRENESISKILRVFVDRKKAEFSTWYEFFPRAASPDANRPGTFKDCMEIIPRLEQLGFDVLYFPPIHPVGKSFRKGKNNSTTALPGEPGSPWAIGNSTGGHKAINPELGTMEDFTALVTHAEKHGIEIALDLAYQCAPDHPYVKKHPQWFRWRPDGTVQYAENPPKKYQDVLPINFENEDWKNLWDELKSIIEFWIDKGIKIFRVDNPHTKPFVFWEWLMEEMRKDHPDVLFLSEAFTRPKIMARLAKVGFHQSYSYFVWRETKAKLEEYLTELTTTELREYMRANFWPNTPDILPYYIQNTGYSDSAIRYILAATLSSDYGMYGPVYELLVNDPVPGKEEYYNSEKYEVRHWDWKTFTPFHALIGRINHIRKENSAFHSTFNITFCETNNEQVMAFIKQSKEDNNTVLVIVNLDPLHRQSAWIKLPLESLGTKEGQGLMMEDLLDGNKYQWNKEVNYVELDPVKSSAHIFRVNKI